MLNTSMVSSNSLCNRNTKYICDNLNQLRRQHYMNQTEFAQYLKIPLPTLRQFLHGINIPSLKSLVHIANACHVSLDWLCINHE